MPHRSLVIFWLLLAATVSVDAVAWAAAEQSRRLPGVVYDALIVGQISVICIWSALRPTKLSWARILPWIAVLIASVTKGPFFREPEIWEGLPYFGLHAALLLAALWLFQRSAFWRQHAGSTSEWKYSLIQLLVAMTVVAVLVATIRYSKRLDDAWPAIAIFICGSTAVTVASVVSWSRPRHVLIRVAGALCAALFIGFAVSMIYIFSFGSGEMPEQFVFLIFSSHYLMQTVVLSIWIGVGQILLPANATASADD